MIAATREEEVTLNTIRNDVTSAAPTEPVRRPAPAAAARAASQSGTLPATPPAELLGELDTAAGVLSTLDAKGLELRLSVGKDAVEVTLQTADGTPVRTIPHRQLLEALAGNGLGIALDEQG